MANFLIGAVTLAAVWYVISIARKNELQLAWWQWLLTAICIASGAFTLAVIACFLAEGAAQAALVTGVILGVITIIITVLLARFVFAPAKA